MSIFQIQFEQKIPASLNEVWEFITNPSNLKRITPPYMGFEITSDTKSQRIYPGMIITYKVRPTPLFKVNWVTEITHIQEKQYFVDEQRVGPYSLWHHEHHIEAIEGGVLMTDRITYKPPVLGGILNKLFIKGQLEKIFSYRKEAFKIIFG